MPPSYHNLSAEQTVQAVETDAQLGLSKSEAARRFERWGGNIIPEQRRRGPLLMLLDQFTDFMILVLIAAAVVAGLVGEPEDTIAIVVIVTLNALIGFAQEYRAERAIAALKQLAAPLAKVRRDGLSAVLPAVELVPGDIVLLEAGSLVPADLRLIEAMQLKLEEAALTGESQAIDKHTQALAERDPPLGDRRNMAYKGTTVAYGRGAGVVVATGLDTELGRIATLLHEEEETKTPLQVRLARFGQRLALVVLGICAIFFAIGLLRGEPLLLMLLTAVSLAVAAIPEALPAVVTISLALGARKMVRQNALIRRLPAVETLGSVTYICSDKTGTLTQNKMRAVSFYVPGELTDAIPNDPQEPWPLLARSMVLNNDTARGAQGQLLGDPTEVAFYQAAIEAGVDTEVLLREALRIGELPFDAERKLMTTLHSDGQQTLAITKGAPAMVLERCAFQLSADQREPLDLQHAQAMVEQMAFEGLRVLAFACRRWDTPPALDANVVETGLEFLGLVGLMDPPRAEAAEAVAQCRSAGIKPVMITGDHPATAQAIAARVGIPADASGVITGVELAALSDVELLNKINRLYIYARVDPAQKIRIVKALQERGEFVAMTGDGVNDAPALRRANIGVAMGNTGTDVAREASHMVLLDDNFATIVRAVREGRRIYDNLRKFVKYTMTSNSGEIWTVAAAPVMGLPILLLPIHILWINLVTDGLPGLALAAEPAEQGVMRRPPRPPTESVFAHGMWQHMVLVGLLMGGLCLFTQTWVWNAAHRQTMVFTVLTLGQLWHALAIRSERESLFAQGLFSNKPLLGAVLFTFGLQLGVIYLPGLNEIFKTLPLSIAELGWCIGVSSLVFAWVEVEKRLVRRHGLYRVPA
jgi:Ca2+-transporting ATPase